MKIIIEEYQYKKEDVKDILWEGAFQDVDGNVSINYVGYYFNPRQEINDCVFILPKVLLEVGSDKVDRVFGKYKPEEIINLDKGTSLSQSHRDFIYQFSVWIYRALSTYRKLKPDPKIIYQKQVSMMGKGRLRRSSTLLDIILALLRFQRENRDFLLFTVKNQHLGFNKINWARTISTTRPVIESKSPIYINPVNKRRVVNFDEELLVIFYSILNYIHSAYGFPVSLDMGYSLIIGKKFQHYLNGFGKVRLRQIKYKYFSDKALRLWDLCMAFFDQPHHINILADKQEYLLAKNFNIVFEAMIDNLIGDADLPAGLKEQEDGKMVDHMFSYRSLISDEPGKDVYYIGDSKYYKRGNHVGKESVYKQFTYARNVIQWNLNLFLDGGDDAVKKDRPAYGKFGKLRDDITEGYNVIPNFFISARMVYGAGGKVVYDDTIEPSQHGEKFFNSRQFENRLFDRDTLLVAHYDVNFLYVVSLYARDSASQKASWKDKVRRMFREKIQGMLKDKFEFYAMTPRSDVDAESFLRENFQMVLGKVYTPYGEGSDGVYFSLAVDKDEKYARENALVKGRLEQGFVMAPCDPGIDPSSVVKAEAPVPLPPTSKKFLTHHWIEKYPENYFLVGCCKDTDHRNWIFKRDNIKRSEMYNVRLGTRTGAVVNPTALTTSPKFLILYDLTDCTKYTVHKIKSSRAVKQAKMEALGYPDAKCDYYCYYLEEEVTLGDLDVVKLLADRKAEMGAGFKNGAPLYLKGGELLGYRVS